MGSSNFTSGGDSELKILQKQPSNAYLKPIRCTKGCEQVNFGCGAQIELQVGRTERQYSPGAQNTLGMVNNGTAICPGEDMTVFAQTPTLSVFDLKTLVSDFDSPPEAQISCCSPNYVCFLDNCLLEFSNWTSGDDSEPKTLGFQIKTPLRSLPAALGAPNILTSAVMLRLGCKFVQLNGNTSPVPNALLECSVTTHIHFQLQKYVISLHRPLSVFPTPKVQN